MAEKFMSDSGYFLTATFNKINFTKNTYYENISEASYNDPTCSHANIA